MTRSTGVARMHSAAWYDADAEPPAYRRLVQSSRPLVGLVVQPPTHAGHVLRALRGLLFAQRGVCSALDAVLQPHRNVVTVLRSGCSSSASSTTSTTATTTSPSPSQPPRPQAQQQQQQRQRRPTVDEAAAAAEATAAAAATVRQPLHRCKVLLLDDACVSWNDVKALMTRATPVTETAATGAAAAATGATAEAVTGATTAAMDGVRDDDDDHAASEHAVHWLLLHDSVASIGPSDTTAMSETRASWQHVLYKRLASVAPQPVNDDTCDASPTPPSLPPSSSSWSPRQTASFATTTTTSTTSTASAQGDFCSPVRLRTGVLRVALIAPYVVHLDYRNYTMPQLLQRVLPLCAAEAAAVVADVVPPSSASSSSSSSASSSSFLLSRPHRDHDGVCDMQPAVADASGARAEAARCDGAVATALSGFEQVGHVAHLNLAHAHLPYRFVIGQILLDCNPTVSVVVNKVTAIASVFREAHVDVIAARRGAVEAAVALAWAATRTAAAAGDTTASTNTPTHHRHGNDKDTSSATSTSSSTTTATAAVVATSTTHANTKSAVTAATTTSLALISSAEDVARVMAAAGRSCADVAYDVLLTALVRQHACVFCVPYGRVYWNSRLSHEHTRLVALLRRGDVLFDVMAGVGPFAVPAARLRGVRVYANDLNPVAAQCLRGNAQRNAVAADALHVYNMDGRDFLNTVLLDYVLTHCGRARNDHHTPPGRRSGGGDGDGDGGDDGAGGRCHVVMNLPALAVQFLDVFAPPPPPPPPPSSSPSSSSSAAACTSPPWYSARVLAAMAACDASVSKRCVLHVYCFSSAADVLRDAVAQVEAALGYRLACAPSIFDTTRSNHNDHHNGNHNNSEDGDVECVHMVRDVSPHKRMVCVSFTLPCQFWQRVSHEGTAHMSSDIACGGDRTHKRDVDSNTNNSNNNSNNATSNKRPRGADVND